MRADAVIGLVLAEPPRWNGGRSMRAVETDHRIRPCKSFPHWGRGREGEGKEE